MFEGAGLRPIPHGRRYGAVLADPPWRFVSYTALRPENWQSRRDVEKHYATLELADICELPVDRVAAADAHLFLWVTGPCLEWGFAVMRAWGFRYSSLGFTWIKLRRGCAGADDDEPGAIAEADLHQGLGLTTRHNAELVLLGRRGNARRRARDVREIVLAPVGPHSAKPDEVQARIERYCAGPYLELFARRRRPGWDAWGDALGGFVGAEEERI